ncbi:hypothetical protein AAC387_Pa04g1690 [Persea americana]
MITLLGHPYTISVPVNFMKRVPVNFAECVTTKLGYSFGDPRGKLQLMIFSLPPSLPKKKKMLQLPSPCKIHYHISVARKHWQKSLLN